MERPSGAEREPYRRRSQRFPHEVTVLLSGTEGGRPVEETGKTKNVSSHGCYVACWRKFSLGNLLRLKLAETGRELSVRVVRVRPDMTTVGWEVGLELAEPGNVWQFEFLPHMMAWPADLPPPSIRVAGPPAPTRAGPGKKESRPAPVTESQQARQVLSEVTQQLTKNAQMALNNVEESIREMSEAARANLDEDLRRLGEQVVEQEAARFRERFEEAVRASLQTLLERLFPPGR